MMKRYFVCAVMALMAILWGCEKKPVLVETVSLSETTLTLVEGETKILTAEIAPANAEDQSVTWSTNDKSVVTVEDGTVTAIKAGEATVTATANDKGGAKAECKVTVTAAKVAVTGVSLNHTSLTVAAGGNAKLTATVAPTNATNKSVTWSSSDEAIATVDSEGNVTVKSAGTATITVTTKDGNKTAECKVTVGIPVTGVSLDETTLTLVEGKSAKLNATVEPADATNKSVTWSSSDEAIATVDSEGNVRAAAVGIATITVTTVDGGHTATRKVRVREKNALEGYWQVTSEKLIRFSGGRWQAKSNRNLKFFYFSYTSVKGELGWYSMRYETILDKLGGKYKRDGNKIEIAPNDPKKSPFTLTNVEIKNDERLTCTIVIVEKDPKHFSEGDIRLSLEMTRGILTPIRPPKPPIKR